MNELEFIRTLAAGAGKPMGLSIDVTGRVLADIASRRPKDVWVFPVAAAISIATALVVGVAAIYAMQSGNPLADMMSVTVSL